MTNFQQINNWIARMIELEQPINSFESLAKVFQLNEEILLMPDHNIDSLKKLVHGVHSNEFGHGFLFTDIELPNFRNIITDIYSPMLDVKTILLVIAQENSFIEEMAYSS